MAQCTVPCICHFSGTGHHMAAACAVEQAVPETGSFAPFVDRRIPETWATCATLIEYDDAWLCPVDLEQQ
jgi:hypothetical protein